ncbi:hypothetical protein [Persicobacter diffluens]|uniref:Uncharacterized protein n=1 Tax=Persicobacter diffluens TaxID=981 RepID=A0AAN4W366_9BACT|nr:hypothetical protein PEDI_46060 [Persicobacter diffluens]
MKTTFNLTVIALKTKNKKQIAKNKKSIRRASKKRRSDRARIKRLKRKVTNLKQELKEEKSKNRPAFGGKKLKYHSYCTSIITLVLILYSETSMSLRDIESVLRAFIIHMQIEGRFPDHSTIDYWIKKAGMRAIKPFCENEPCVLIYDESISFNGKKLFLVLAVPTSISEKQKPLCFEDCHLVYLGAKKSWTGDVIHEELAPIVAKMDVQYILSDQDSNLIKATELLNIPQVFDITHKVAGTLKNS